MTHFPYQLIEETILPFEGIIGKDYERYRNHVYRVFLTCLLIDDTDANRDKYAIAAVFHDIGIWTDNTFDYLLPSIDRANAYLESIGKQEWIPEITSMIYWHHKTGKYSKSSLVETFRKSDWIDVSLGIIKFGVDPEKIAAIRRSIPNKGFHLFLLKQSGKNFVIHPLKPLPMFPGKGMNDR